MKGTGTVPDTVAINTNHVAPIMETFDDPTTRVMLKVRQDDLTDDGYRVIGQIVETPRGIWTGPDCVSETFDAGVVELIRAEGGSGSVYDQVKERIVDPPEIPEVAPPDPWSLRDATNRNMIDAPPEVRAELVEFTLLVSPDSDSRQDVICVDQPGFAMGTCGETGALADDAYPLPLTLHPTGGPVVVRIVPDTEQLSPTLTEAPIDPSLLTAGAQIRVRVSGSGADARIEID